jgi:hypothetical protein
MLTFILCEAGTMTRKSRNLRRFAMTAASLSTIALLAACGTPMPAGQAPAPGTPQAETPAPPVAGTVATPAAPTATPGLAARERLQLAVNLLSQGNPTQAALELRAYLAEVPNSAQAKTLLSHIETRWSSCSRLTISP